MIPQSAVTLMTTVTSLGLLILVYCLGQLHAQERQPVAVTLTINVHGDRRVQKAQRAHKVLFRGVANGTGVRVRLDPDGDLLVLGPEFPAGASIEVVDVS